MTSKTAAPILDAADEVRANIALILSPKGMPCVRCGGKGYREDIKNWVFLKGTENHDGGKVCFRCMGSCTEPRHKFADPLTVRQAVAHSLVELIANGDLGFIVKQIERETARGTYMPVLGDVFSKAVRLAAKNADEGTLQLWRKETAPWL